MKDKLKTFLRVLSHAYGNEIAYLFLTEVELQNKRIALGEYDMSAEEYIHPVIDQSLYWGECQSNSSLWSNIANNKNINDTRINFKDIFLYD